MYTYLLYLCGVSITFSANLTCTWQIVYKMFDRLMAIIDANSKIKHLY